ncbi:MAG: tRNA (adenosine(37)-N6)-threonylcarbamoyltransferase complex ATPase subunit type 1 TsaE [Candidatus Omnitrophota bacterium]
MKTLTTNSPEETIDIAARLAGSLENGDVIALIGDLGTGKTMFVKGLAKGLDVGDHLYVNSPSFVIVKEYSGRKKLYHFDVYRLERSSFSDTLDYERYFYDEGIVVIEWAEKIKDLLPEEYLEIRITHEDMTKRRFEFNPVGERYRAVIERL